MATIKDKKELLELASDLPKFLKKHKWVSRYDVETDAFSLTLPKLSVDTRIHYIDDEIAFYMNKKNNIEGIFVEYFKSNFISHNERVKKVLEDLEEGSESENVLIKLNDRKIKMIAPELQEAIRSSIADKIKISFSK